MNMFQEGSLVDSCKCGASVLFSILSEDVQYHSHLGVGVWHYLMLVILKAHVTTFSDQNTRVCSW